MFFTLIHVVHVLTTLASSAIGHGPNAAFILGEKPSDQHDRAQRMITHQNRLPDENFVKLMASNGPDVKHIISAHEDDTMHMLADGDYVGHILTDDGYVRYKLADVDYTEHISFDGGYEGLISADGDYPGHISADGDYPGHISADGDYARHISADGDYAGYISADGDYAGHISADGDYTGHIPADGDYAGHISADGDYARHILADGEYAGHISADGDYTGHISADGDYAGHISADGDYAGHILADGDYAGHISDDGDYAGHISADGDYTSADEENTRNFMADGYNIGPVSASKEYIIFDRILDYNKSKSNQKRTFKPAHTSMTDHNNPACPNNNCGLKRFFQPFANPFDGESKTFGDNGGVRTRRSLSASEGFGNVTREEGDPTCLNKCGTLRLSPCSCHVTCFVHRTCCENVTIECPFLEEEARAILGDDLMDNKGHVICDGVNKVFIVTKCLWPKVPTSVPTDDLISTLYDMAVVYDNETRLVFKNQSVYNCYRNSSDNLLPWIASFKIDRHSHIKDYVINPNRIIRNIDPKYATFAPQSELVEGVRCIRTIDSCKKELAHLDPFGLCGSFTSHYFQPGKKEIIYGNRFCYYCNLNRTDGLHGTIIKFVRGFGLSVTMDFSNSRNDLTVKLNITGPIHSYSWTAATCNINISMSAEPRNREGTMPHCDSRLCSAHWSFWDGKCVKLSAMYFLLRHPEKRFQAREILDLAEFLTCYLTERQPDIYIWVVHPMGVIVQRFVRSLNFTDFDSTNKDTFEVEEDYFLIKIPMIIESSGTFKPGDFRQEVSNVLGYWFLRGGYVEETEEGLLYFVNHYKQTEYVANETHGSGHHADDRGNDHGDGGADLKDSRYIPHDHQRKLLTGLVLLSFDNTVLPCQKSLSPIGSSEAATAETKMVLDRCYSKRGVVDASRAIAYRTNSMSLGIFVLALAIVSTPW